MEKKIKAVVFDMDGVIFDSERLVFEGWKIFGEKYKMTDLERVYHLCIGTNTQRTKEILLENYGKDFPYDEYRREYSSYFWDQCNKGLLPIKTGVEAILEYLKEEGYLLAVASSTRYEVVEKELKEANLLQYFQNLTCGDMVKKSKPEPDIYLLACQNLGVRPECAVAIEDSYNGVRSASRAGMYPIMVPDMIPPNDEMRQIAGGIFEDLYKVKEWFAGKFCCI